MLRNIHNAKSTARNTQNRGLGRLETKDFFYFLADSW